MPRRALRAVKTKSALIGPGRRNITFYLSEEQYTALQYYCAQFLLSKTVVIVAALESSAVLPRPAGERAEWRRSVLAHAHKVRYQTYMRRYHQVTRPSPAPEPQGDGSLPPSGQLLVDDDGTRVCCHVCGRWFGFLPVHIRTHGMDSNDYKERYGLARGLALASPQHSERQRQAAIDRGAGDASRLEPHPRPKGIANRLSSRIASSEGQSM